MQTTQTVYDAAISGEVFRPLSSFETPAFDVAEGDRPARGAGAALRRRRQYRLRRLGQRAAHPHRGRPARRRHLGHRAGRGRRRAAARLPVRLRLERRGHRALALPVHLFPGRAASTPRCSPSCRSTGTAASTSPSSASRPHVTAGAGGFVDITARARKIVFSGYFTAGAALAVEHGALAILREGKVRKLVDEVEHVSFSGRRAVAQGQHITYVTERCVMELRPEGVVVTEIAPGVESGARHPCPGRSSRCHVACDQPKLMDARAVPARARSASTLGSAGMSERRRDGMPTPSASTSTAARHHHAGAAGEAERARRRA